MVVVVVVCAWGGGADWQCALRLRAWPERKPGCINKLGNVCVTGFEACAQKFVTRLCADHANMLQLCKQANVNGPLALKLALQRHIKKPPVGIEPTTIRLRSACSAS